MSEPTTERLAKALEEAGAPAYMIEKARQGYYDDFKSPIAMNMTALVTEARKNRLYNIAARATAGEFDSTKEEAEAWAKGTEGRKAFRELRGD